MAVSQDYSMIVSTDACAPSTFKASTLPTALPPEASTDLRGFVWRESERPLVAHNQFEHEEDLPMIDLSPLLMNTTCDIEKKACVEAMAEACKGWGFFQIINHGVPAYIVEEMESQARYFFRLPAKQKWKVLREATTGKPMGYSCAGVGTRLTSELPWMESLQLPAVCSDIDDYSRRIWDDGNPDFRKAVCEFGEALRRLSVFILDVLSRHLGFTFSASQLIGGELCDEQSYSDVLVDVGHQIKTQSKSNSVVRLNCYPPCPQPALTLGLGAHSDPHILTVLHQDDVGGLQILKDNQWIAVKPKPHSLVVIFGDIFQVLSNDLCKSVEHRAVCNMHCMRLSTAFFLNPVDEAVVAPQFRHGEEEDRVLYKPFTWQEYREYLYSQRPSAKSNLNHFRIQKVLNGNHLG